MTSARRFPFWLAVVLSVVVSASAISSAWAGISYTGNVDPEDPSTWTSGTKAKIGYIPDNDVNNGYGSITVDGGDGIIAQRGYIGYDSGSSGEATISGEGSTWTIGSGLYAGYMGNGVLNISDGGKVTVRDVSTYIGYDAGSIGKITIDGDYSTFTASEDSDYFYVGYDGSATVEITNGGSLFYDSNRCYIGYESGSSGTVSVDGIGSTCISSNSYYIGYYGSGTMKITNGATATCDRCLLGIKSGSIGELTVEGSDSTFSTCGGLLRIDNGTLKITSEAEVNSSYGYIGYYDSTGEVTVDGENSAWNISADLEIGCHGNGTLNVTNCGNVSVTGTTYVYDSYGTVDFGTNGGTLTTNTLYVSPASQLSGTGLINTCGIVSDANIVLDASGNSDSTYTFTLPSQNNGQVVVNLDQSNCAEDIGSGYIANGSLTVQNGAQIRSNQGYIGYYSGSTGTITIDGSGSSWTNTNELLVGKSGNGTLIISNGGVVSCGSSNICDSTSASGAVIVDGSGSEWNVGGTLGVGYDIIYLTSAAMNGQTIFPSNLDVISASADGAITITNGGVVHCENSYISYSPYSSGEVVVDGVGSTWRISNDLVVGCYLTILLGTINNNVSGNVILSYPVLSKDGNLFVTNGGLVSVGGTLTIDFYGCGNAIYMSTGGMLALLGDADGSLEEFYSLIDGNGAIRYWDEDAGAWESLSGATLGTDYTLEYFSDGDLSGYTMLTVGVVPEPGTFALLAAGLLGLGAYAFRKRAAAVRA